MERNEVETKYKWDLSLIYKNIDEFNQDLTKANTLLESIVHTKDNFTDSKEAFLTFNQDMVLLSRLIQKTYNYAHLHVDVEPDTPLYQELLSKVLSFDNTVTNSLDYIEVEMIKNKEKILQYLDDPEFKEYRYSINQTLRKEKHLLSQEMETLISKVAPLANISESVYDAFNLEFKPVEFDGESHELNAALMAQYLKDPRQEVRRQTYHHFFSEYKKYENVFAATLAGKMHTDTFYADVRKYASPLSYSQFYDEAPEELFYKILEKANVTYRPLFHRYNRLKKQLLNLEHCFNYDLNVPLVKPVNSHYEVEDCFKIIKDVVKVFGEEYLSIIDQAKEERWIDFFPTKNKRTGGYSSGCYDTKPYILLNFIGDYDSLSTMIHELGHSAHTYLSTKYQEPVNSDYRIFVAEVASTVNETLLINYMLDHSQTKEEKAYYLYEFLENCVGLIYRQPMYAQFEDIIHKWALNNEPMNASRIVETYAKLNQEYFGDDIEMDELVGYHAFYVPHFYYNYYVYKYTLGMTVALAIVSRILKGDQKQVEDYLNFLKSGGSKSPIDLLKSAGVNPLEDQIYDDAFSYFEKLLNEFEEMMK